jgi:hypothetical protein
MAELYARFNLSLVQGTYTGAPSAYTDIPDFNKWDARSCNGHSSPNHYFLVLGGQPPTPPPGDGEVQGISYVDSSGTHLTPSYYLFQTQSLSQVSRWHNSRLIRAIFT